MQQIKHISIIGKFLIVLAMFVTVSIASTVFSTSEMRRIDDGYGDAIAHEGHGALFVTEGAKALFGVKSAMTDLQISDTDAGNAAALADLKNKEQAFLDFMAKAAAAMPGDAEAINALRARGQKIIDQTCAKALAMGAAAVKPPDLIAAQSEHLKSCAPAFPRLIADLVPLTERSVAELDRKDIALSDVTNSPPSWSPIS